MRTAEVPPMQISGILFPVIWHKTFGTMHDEKQSQILKSGRRIQMKKYIVCFGDFNFRDPLLEGLADALAQKISEIL